MQPYLFPYIGYFQFIKAVDLFVIHDDVQWIKGGWINRNRCILQGQPTYFTMPVAKDSYLLNINQRVFVSDIELYKKRIHRQIGNSYKKAPYFESAFSLVSKCLFLDESNVAAFTVNSLRECCDYLNVTTPFVLSSELKKNNELKAQERILDINRVVGSHHYVNPISGIDLYDKVNFAEKGVRLSFLKPRKINYSQFEGIFFPFLSIIDVMMFNSKIEIAGLLEGWDLE